MNRVYLHSKNNVNTLINLIFYLLIPFALFGFYKNGLSLYHKHLISLWQIFKPLIFIMISLLVTFILNKILKKHFIGYELLGNILISLIVSPNTNLIIYLILLVVINFLLIKVKFNFISVFMLANSLILFLEHKYTYLNVFESSVQHNYSLLDYIVGKGPGGIGNTFLIMSIIALIILLLNINYKRQIPISGLATFYILMLITTFIKGPNLDLLLNNNLIFAYIFICPISIYSPYSKGACYIYGVLLGLLTYLFSFLDIDLGIYIAITILSFGSPLLDIFIVGKSNNQLIDVL